MKRMNIESLRTCMKICTTALLALLCTNSLYAQWNVNGNYSISGNVGIGTSSSGYKLDIVNQSGEPQDLIRIKVYGAPNDYLKISNATLTGSQFIPDIYAVHTSDNRQALYITGVIGNTNDSGSEPIMVFDSRIEDVAVTNRPLFAWESYGTRKMLMSAAGNLALGVSNPLEKLSLNGGIWIPKATGTDNDSPGLVTVSDDDFLYDGQYINNYGLGFHDFNDGNGYAGINGYASGYYGYDIFTGAAPRLRVNHNGNVGIGVTAPQAKLHVADGMGGEQLRLSRGTGSVRFAQDNNQDNLYLFNHDASQTFMFWKANGDIGIGTNTPDAKLAVKGSIHTEEVRVDLNVPGPDYVFEADYDLLALPALEKYIRANKHLPEIPSSEAMQRDGIFLKEMNLLLLKKIEELTLHQIELNKGLAEQSSEILQLRQDIAQLKAKLNK